MKRLFIDIPALLESNVSAEEIECEYMFHRKNPGHFSLLEIAEFAVYCRQCKDAFCVTACPKEALERLDNGTIKRYNMRCVGCKSCILACPFGTIFPEVINYITAKCDYCLNQLEEDPNYEPLCTKTAPAGTFEMKEIENEEPENNIYFYGEHLAIKSQHWRKKEDKI
jgi:Fe-S-cluster-containing dehydrogenase component